MTNDQAEVTAPTPRDVAADYVARFLAQQKLQAEGTIRECDDAEVADIVKAGTDRHTARDQIKFVLARAYDRRRETARKEASEFEDRVRRSRAAGETNVTEEGTQPVVTETPAAVVETPAPVVETPATPS